MSSDYSLRLEKHSSRGFCLFISNAIWKLGIVAILSTSSVSQMIHLQQISSEAFSKERKFLKKFPSHKGLKLNIPALTS